MTAAFLSRWAYAYQPARSSGTGWSNRRWPRAWPGSSVGADLGHCPSEWQTGSSRRFFSAWYMVSQRLLSPPAGRSLWRRRRGCCRWYCAYLAILKLEDQLHLVALNLLLNHLGGDPAVGDVWLPCPGAVLVDVCHGGGRVPHPLFVLVGVTLRVQDALVLCLERVQGPAR
jgi:hypothetical protein